MDAPTTQAVIVKQPRNIDWENECLKLQSWNEDLSPAQLQKRDKILKEIEEVNNRVTQLIYEFKSSETLHEGDNCILYELGTKGGATSSVVPPAAATAKNNMKLVMDPRSGVVVGTMSPSATVASPTLPAAQNSTLNNRANTRKRTIGRSVTPPGTAPAAKVARSTPDLSPSVTITATSKSNSSTADVVDLTSEDNNNSKSLADSREVSFNKLQGKTFPSLVVVARPHLRQKENNSADRAKLDAKVKAVLMHIATKFTEWWVFFLNRTPHVSYSVTTIRNNLLSERTSYITFGFFLFFLIFYYMRVLPP